MPINRKQIGSVAWRNSWKHEPKSVLIQLVDIDYSKKDKYTKDELIEMYYQKLCAEDNSL